MVKEHPQKKLIKILIRLIISSLLCVFPTNVFAQYDPTFIISDEVFKDYNSMTEEEINNFLISKGSWLANYIIPEYISVPYPYLNNGNVELAYVDAHQAYDKPFYGKRVSKLIYDEAQEHKINPRVILVLSQRESSAITRGAPSSKLTEAWPLFYYFTETMAGCLAGDTSKCDNNAYRQKAIDFGGVGQQIAYATWWLDYRYQLYFSNKQYLTPIAIDGGTYLIRNAATYVLYKYTPHLLAQKNFYDIFQSWFCDPTGSSCGSYAPSPSTSEVPNDTQKYSNKTYAGSIKLKGTKSAKVRVYFNNAIIADIGSTIWELEIRPEVGLTRQSIIYKDEGGGVIAEKVIEIERHKMADINGDARVNILDLSILANYFGQQNPSEPLANLNPEVDNEVNILDLSILASNWNGD